MRTRRCIVVATTAALVAAGCSGDPELVAPTVVATVSEGPTAPTPSETPAQTTEPVPSPTASSTPLVPPPSTGGPVSDTPAILTEELAGLEHPKSGGSCPVAEVGGGVIVDCAAVQAPGGSVAVIVEELADTRHIATLLRLDDDQDLWLPVAFSEHYGFTVPNSPWVAVTLQPVQNLFSGDMILVEGVVGGSGAVTGWDVVAWPSGKSSPHVIAAFAPEGQVSLRIAGGAVYQTIANHSDGAPNCCPNLQDRRLINLAEGFGRIWEELPNDQVPPIVAAFELYQRWVNDDEVGAAAWATSEVIDELWPAPLFDVHQVVGTECVPMAEAFQCSFQNEAGVRHFLVAPGGLNGYEVVGLIGTGD